MSEEPKLPRRLVWPKYLLAALALFLVASVLMMLKEINRVERIRQESQDLRNPAPQFNTNQTNSRP
jgi:hypothetical protein